MSWVDTETGEIADAQCPHCEETKEWAETQVRACEMELRRFRSKVTKLENEAERQAVARRDGAAWKEFLRCYQLAFPAKRLTATGIKSATATKFFVRLESGATVEDTINAIAGAYVYPYVVFGKRVKTGSKSDHAIHPQDILSVNNDALFDSLRDAGAELRAGKE